MNKWQTIINLILRAVGVGLGVAVVVLNVLGELQTGAAMTILGIGLACMGISLLSQNKK